MFALFCFVLYCFVLYGSINATNYPMLLVVEKGRPIENNEIFEVIDTKNEHVRWKVLQNELPLIKGWI